MICVFQNFTYRTCIFTSPAVSLVITVPANDLTPISARPLANTLLTTKTDWIVKVFTDTDDFKQVFADEMAYSRCTTTFCEISRLHWLTRAMAGHMVGTKALQSLTIELDVKEWTLVQFKFKCSNFIIFYHENLLVNVVYNTAAVMFRPQCIKPAFLKTVCAIYLVFSRRKIIATFHHSPPTVLQSFSLLLAVHLNTGIPCDFWGSRRIFWTLLRHSKSFTNENLENAHLWSKQWACW